MKLTETLKNKNRTLLEVDTGVLLWTVLATAVGFALPLRSWDLSLREWCPGIWTAAVLAVVSLAHMQRCLDRALEYDEGTATKLIFRGYILRYASFAAILIAAALTEVLNPLILCLGYLLIMKTAVYSQPFIHKFYNKMFHETDPEPEAAAEQKEDF